MLTFIDPSFWLYFVLFLFSIFLAFYIPGNLLARYLKLTVLQSMVISLLVGMVMWGLQGFVFGFLQIRFLTYVYLVITVSWWGLILFKNRREAKKDFRVQNTDTLFAVLIGVGVIIQLLPIFFTGVLYPNGMLFCCGNISDNLYHIALTNQIVKQMPPYEPGMYGVVVHNYHYLSNLVVAELVRVFHLPLIWTQYQYSTLFISLMLGLSILVFGQVSSLKKSFTAWLLFFLYFGGDVLYLIIFFFGKGLNFQMSPLEEGTTFLQNPPRAFSIVVLMCGLALFSLWIKKKDMRTGLVMAIVFGSLIGFKVYTGFFVLCGLGCLGVYYLFKRKFILAVPLIVTLLISLLIYLPVNSGSGGLFYTGSWRFENFAVQPHLDLMRMVLALNIYKEHHSILRIIEYQLIFFTLYVVGMFGTKLVGLIQTKKSFKQFPLELHMLLVPSLLASAILGFFYQQTSGGANTFNFLVSFFLIGSFYTALTCSYVTDALKGALKYVFIGIIILFTIPRVVYSTIQTSHLLTNREGFLLTSAQVEGFTYLSNMSSTNTMILAAPDFSFNLQAPYISFLVPGNVYFSNKGILDSHGVDTKERSEVTSSIFTDPNAKVVIKNLNENHINYLILNENEQLRVATPSAFTKIVFKNKEMTILQYVPETHNL